MRASPAPFRFPINRHPGITLIEILVVIFLLSAIGVLGFTRLSATRQKQAIIDTVTQLQVALDSARVNSVAQTPNPAGTPTAWGVVINHRSSPKLVILAPFGPPQSPFDAIPPPAGFRNYMMTPNAQLSTIPSGVLSNNNQLLFVSFESLTGKPVIKKLNQNGQLIPGYTYNSNANLEIIIQNEYGQQSVIINPAGITTVTKFR